MKNIIQIITSGIGLIIGYCFGCFDIFLQLLIYIMIADYITGIIASFVSSKRPKLSSKIGFYGIIKKVFMLLIISLCHRLDLTFNINALRYLSIMYYIGNEGLSILENLSYTKVPIPSFIKKYLEELRKESGNIDTSYKKP